MSHSVPPYSFWETVSQDAKQVNFEVNPHALLLTRLLQVRRAMRTEIGFACVFWLRVNQLFVLKRWPGKFRIHMWRQYRFANHISPDADIGPGFRLGHISDIAIGGSATIGKNVTMYNGVTIAGISGTHLPKIGDNVTIFPGAKIIKPITIGDNVVIGALALCNNDIPANSVMYGIPPNVTVKPRTD